MPAITSLDELSKLKEELIEKKKLEASRGLTTVTVGMGTCGIAAGALEVFRALQEEIKLQGLEQVRLTQTGCAGLCKHEPIVEVVIGYRPKVSYGRVTPEAARRIARDHLLGGKTVDEFVVDTTPYPTI